MKTNIEIAKECGAVFGDLNRGAFIWSDALDAFAEAVKKPLSDEWKRQFDAVNTNYKYALDVNKSLQEQLAHIATLGIIQCACGKWTPVVEEGVDHVCRDCSEAYLQQLCYSIDKRAEKAEEQLAASQAHCMKMIESVEAYLEYATPQSRNNALIVFEEVKNGDTSALDAIRQQDKDKDKIDAARYRWLRENRDVMLVTSFFGNGCINRTVEEVDAAIDSAMIVTPNGKDKIAYRDNEASRNADMNNRQAKKIAELEKQVTGLEAAARFWLDRCNNVFDENAELRKKLAEQQAELLRHAKQLSRCLIQQIDAAELSKLISEEFQRGREVEREELRKQEPVLEVYKGRIGIDYKPRASFTEGSHQLYAKPIPPDDCKQGEQK